MICKSSVSENSSGKHEIILDLEQHGPLINNWKLVWSNLAAWNVSPVLVLFTESCLCDFIFKSKFFEMKFPRLNCLICLSLLLNCLISPISLILRGFWITFLISFHFSKHLVFLSSWLWTLFIWARLDKLARPLCFENPRLCGKITNSDICNQNPSRSIHHIYN